MKRFTALLLSVLLLCSFAQSASAAKMVQTFATDYFQIYIPGDWIIDTSEATDYFGALDLGYMYAPDESMLIESKLFFYGDWSQDSLWLENQDAWADYMEFLLDDLKDENPRFLSKFYAGQFPGMLLTGTNEYGSYLYGEVMINAYAYGFYFYQLDGNGGIDSDITPENIEFFQSVLETFTPIFKPAST